MPPARSGPPDLSPEDAATLALFMQACARRTGLPLTHPYVEAMAAICYDAVPYMPDLIDWGHGNLNVYIERGWIATVAPAKSYRATPRPKPVKAGASPS
jgi:hypothetical protein